MYVLFPDKMDQKVEIEKREKSEAIELTYAQSLSTQNHVSIKTDGQDIFWNSFAFAFMISSVICIGDCSIKKSSMGGVNAFFDGLSGWFYVIIPTTIIIAIIMIALDCLADKKRVKSNDMIFKKAESIKKKELKKLDKECTIRKDNYRKEFENSVQIKCAQYMTSKVTEDIKNWLLSKFEDKLKNIDRSNYIEILTLVFKYEVYNHCIAINPEEAMNNPNDKIHIYDFKEQRCELLSDATDVDALSRALVSNLQFELMKKYSMDNNGREADIKITQNYKDLTIETTIIYEIKNPYFKEQVAW